MRFSKGVLVAAFLSVGLLTACGGSSFSSSTPMSIGPQIAAHQSAVPSAASYKSLYSFKGGSDGATPIGTTLLAVSGSLYGMTSAGGTSGDGTVFTIDPSTGAERVLYSFQGGTDGASPRGGLIEVNGALYGTTRYGGGTECSSGEGCGTVFTISTAGKEQVLYRFEGGSGDGANPYVTLVSYNGVLYGTALGGGTYGGGIVYSVTTAGAESVLHSFEGPPTDGYESSGNLIYVKGTLYGTTQLGGGGSGCGSTGCGTVYSVDSSTGAEKVLYSFKSFKLRTSGAFPDASLIDKSGLLYGMSGGNNTKRCASGCGNVFDVNSTTGAASVLYTFTGGTDGAGPFANLLEVKNVFYGTTDAGGGSGCPTAHTKGCGTIVSVNSSGAETVLYRFTGSPDGSFPQTNLVELKGKLYGTTVYGGAAGDGTVFELQP